MITLTPRAEQCLQVLHALDRGELLMAQAAELLGRSVRQVRRLRRAYRTRGAAALVHGNRGRPAANRIPPALRQRVVTLARTTYANINHQHLTELLAARDGITLSRPSVRRILAAAGLQSPRRRRPPRHRRRRERMPQPGLLVQIDGSDHDWLEQRGPRLTLLAAIDDATGEVCAATFREEEDAHGYLLLLRTLTQTKGLPVAIYSDRHGIFRRTPNHAPTVAEQLAGGPAPTHVGRALQELGIQWIPAHSPQAKGRIERLFGTFQDRLRSELRVAHVRTRTGANAFLTHFLRRYNRRFARPAAQSRSAYRPWPRGVDPQTVFCFKYQRVVSNDNTVTLGPHCVQLLPGLAGRSYAKARVEVHERLDGRIAIVYQHRLLASTPVAGIPTARVPARDYSRLRVSEPPARSPAPQRRPMPKRVTLSLPAADHPWRHMPVGTAKQMTASVDRTKSLNA